MMTQIAGGNSDPSAEGYFDKGLHLNDLGLALYVDGLKLKRVDQLPKAVREHVSECAQCRKDVYELELVMDDRKYARLDSHPYFGQLGGKREIRYLYRLAASVAILIGIGAAGYFLGVFRFHGNAPEPQAQQNVAIPELTQPGIGTETGPAGQQAETQGTLASNFEPSPNLEGVVGKSVRSSLVEVTSPKVGEVVKGNIDFRWKGEANTTYTLVVLNNREDVYKQVTVRGLGYVLTEKLKDGLYYWKLQANGDLLYVGKFVVGLQPKGQ